MTLSVALAQISPVWLIRIRPAAWRRSSSVSSAAAMLPAGFSRCAGGASPVDVRSASSNEEMSRSSLE